MAVQVLRQVVALALPHAATIAAGPMALPGVCDHAPSSWGSGPNLGLQFTAVPQWHMRNAQGDLRAMHEGSTLHLTE